jgi:Type II secretion system (T2SS), protein M subtype b
VSRLPLSRRDRRALLMGVGGVLGLIAAARGIPAWLQWQREARASAAERLTELASAESSLRNEPAVRDSLAASARRMLALAPSLLSGDTPAAAGATLAGLVSGAAAQASTRLGALQVRADSMSHGTFTRIAVMGNATGDVQGVAELLSALEHGPTLLAVRELSVSQTDPAAPVDRMEVLHVDFAVEGLMLNARSAGKR